MSRPDFIHQLHKKVNQIAYYLGTTNLFNDFFICGNNVSALRTKLAVIPPE